MAYTATHKRSAREAQASVPGFERSDGSRPAGEFEVAEWLPVSSSYYDNGVEEYVVIPAGKVVSFDRQGKVVPAGLKLGFQVAGGSTALTYTAADVTAGTKNLTTGAAVSAATSYTQTQLTTALRSRGLIRATETARDFIGWGVGYLTTQAFQFSGSFDPTTRRRHNFQLQAGLTIGCDQLLAVPYISADVTSETMGDGAISSAAITFGTTQFVDSTGIGLTTRYSSLVSAGDNVVAYVFATYPVAKITANTPIVDSASNLASMREVDSIAAVIAGGSGTFYIDYDAGVMFLWESGGNAVPTGWVDGTTTINYYSYESAESTTSYPIVGLTGDIMPGDFVGYNSNSDFVKWSIDIGTAFGGASGAAYAADPEYDTETDNSVISAQVEAAVLSTAHLKVGQFLGFESWPKGGLDKVMTGMSGSGFLAQDKMPGTATAGLSDANVRTGSANILALINFNQR